ncbi:ArnT family glycosyltransferase [Desulfurivibrio sp. D14AmB]|uniref:ArnT family glycosyltransferase n=1 Tax=Desulfurivibrio sp. D14AmB TaxID=3374370 RepID=UPI00376EBA18
MASTEISSRREQFLALTIALLAVVLPLILHSLRSLDDNRLVSWGQVANLVPPVLPLAGLLLMVPIAYGLARFPLPGPPLLFPLAFLASTLFWGMPETIVDAARYFTQAKHLAVYGPGFFLGEWGNQIDAWTDLPLLPLLYGLIFKYAGEVRLYAQILNSLLFAMAVTTTALLATELWDREIGDLAGVLLLAVPYLFTQTPLLLVDIGAMAFLLLAAYLFLIALRRGGLLLIGASALAILLAFCSKYSVWPMLSILGVEFLLVLREAPAATLRRGWLIAGLTGLLLAPIALYYAEVIAGQLTLLREFQRPGLRAWGESFLSTFLFQTHPFVTVGAVASLVLALSRRDPRYLVAAWLLLLFIPGMQVRRIRYLVPLFPLLAIMAAYGFSAIGSARLRRFAAYCAAGGSLVIAQTAYLPFLQSHSLANLKAAGAFMDSLAGQTFLVETTPPRSVVNPAVAVPLLDLYTRKTIHYDYRAMGKPAEEDLARLSLRFTWSYSNPPYYPPPAGLAPDALVIIWGAGETYPPKYHYSLAKKFTRSEKIYSFQTHVGIFLPREQPAEVRPVPGSAPGY